VVAISALVAISAVVVTGAIAVTGGQISSPEATCVSEAAL